MTIFQDRYRVETSRLRGKDYGEVGTYFVTMCTKGREHWFGEVRNERMILNTVGMIVAEEIVKTPLLRKYIVIDTWIVMPNHVHMIVDILPNSETSTVETARCAVSQDVAILIPMPRLKPNSLGSIVGRIKAASAWRIRKAGYRNFAWQERFHDRILRTDRAIENVLYQSTCNCTPAGSMPIVAETASVIVNRARNVVS
ncbi:MAG: hypothetical protein Greene041662_951, partial [Candidatus Peregrinibacteria bacterium Greene0416_62]